MSMICELNQEVVVGCFLKEAVMNKFERYRLYEENLYPGWWWLLDRYIPRIMKEDPGCQVSIRETYGVLRVDLVSSTIQEKTLRNVEEILAFASTETCEICGSHGKLCTNISPVQTLCRRCELLELEAKFNIAMETEQRWIETAQDEL